MKDLKKVDWGKAPEGATHYNAACVYPWLKEAPASYYDDDIEYWVEYKTSNVPVDFIDAVKRPQEWDGSGVPPVGTVCEYRLNEYDVWFKCKIKYVLSGSFHSFVAWCDHLGVDQFLTFSSDEYELQLRKIKTLEQGSEDNSVCNQSMTYTVR